MFIKTLRHKGNSIKHLLDYIFNGIRDKDNDWVLAHNLPSLQHTEIVKAYLQNDQFRSNRAKVRWYHEVLSFSPLDREHLDDTKLWDLAQKYIELRNPHALVYAAPHKEEQHIHIHFAFSAIEYKSSKTLRMNDEVFENLHYQMEEYQLEKYPELKHSFVYLHRERKRNTAQKRDRNARQESYFQWQHNHPDQTSEKESLKTYLLEIYAKSQSRQEFYVKLRESGLELYEYRGKIAGIQGKRKYRFSTLDISKEQMRSLDRLEQHWREMQDLQQERDDIARDLG